MKKKLLIFGISGLLGSKLAKLAMDYEVFGTFNQRSTQIENAILSKLDISDFEQIDDLFNEIKPDFVINTTALHNVDYCEKNPDESFLINSKVVKTIQENCTKIGSTFVHLSTDYVFDGKQKTPYTETDVPSPLSIYGKSKLEGEGFVSENHCVIRPSVIYGWNSVELSDKTSSSGKSINFAMWLLSKLHKVEDLKIVNDQFTTSTLADSLAEAILTIIKNPKAGIYHVSGLSCESRFEFAIKLAKEFGYDYSKIQSVDSSQFKQIAPRPAFSCLNCQKSINQFGLQLLSTEDSLQIMKKQISKEAPHMLQKR